MSAVLSMALEAKELATAKARAALWGGQLSAIEDDDGQPLLVITRWSLTRSFRGRAALAEVNAWLKKVGAPA